MTLNEFILYLESNENLDDCMENTIIKITVDNLENKIVSLIINRYNLYKNNSNVAVMSKKVQKVENGLVVSDYNKNYKYNSPVKKEVYFKNNLIKESYDNISTGFPEISLMDKYRIDNSITYEIDQKEYFTKFLEDNLKDNLNLYMTTVLSYYESFKVKKIVP